MFHNLMARLKATPPWVWITVALAAVGVVISFLIYRNGVNTPTGDTSGQAAGGVQPGDTTGGYSPYGNGSSQYQPDYSTQSLLQQIINLLNRPATPTPSPTPTPTPNPIPSPIPSPIHLPPPVAGGFQQPRRTVSAPPLVPHPVLPPPPAPAPPPAARTGTVPARQQPDFVIGSVNHADGHVGTQPHPGAISITIPHPLQQRQMGF